MQPFGGSLSSSTRSTSEWPTGEIALQRLEEQGVLVPEGLVETALVQAGRGHEVVQRRGLIAFGPESDHSRVQDLVDVEFSGSTNHGGAF
jgi:hypothetical protein